MARHSSKSRSSVMSETRQKLLLAAVEELAVQGFDKANVNRIAENAGFSIGTLYNYFPSKRHLMHAFIDLSAQQHVAFIQETVTQSVSPADRLIVFFESGFAFIEQNLTQARAIFNTLNGPDEGFKNRLFSAYQPLFQLLSEQVIKPGIQQGIFRPTNPQETAGMIMLVYLGAGSQFNRDGKLWVSPSQVSDFVLNALNKTQEE